MASWTRLACPIIELAGKSKQDTAPRKLRFIPCANSREIVDLSVAVPARGEVKENRGHVRRSVKYRHLHQLSRAGKGPQSNGPSASK
jgi:hypothetical protein